MAQADSAMLAQKTISPHAFKASAADETIDALKSIIPTIEANAAKCDRLGAFPVDDTGLLSQIGLLKAFALFENGGREFENLQVWVDCLFRCLRLIGGANLSLGRIFEGHVNAIVLIERYGNALVKKNLQSALNQGKLFGVWNTQPDPGVALSSRQDGWALSGCKSYATGCGNLDYALITARLSDGAKQMLIIDVAAQPERADSSAWRTSGMRGTISGIYDFSDIAVTPDAFLGGPGDYEREPIFTGGAWRFTAVQLGAIETLLTLLRDHLKLMKTDADPIQRARFGRAVAETRSAHLWVRQAAARAELNPASDTIPLVLMTRNVVENAGLTVIEAAQRSIGTKAFFTANPVDRIMRDLALYLRQPAPDAALDKAAAAWLEADRWRDDPWW